MIYSANQLDNMNVKKELKPLAKDLGIIGYSKKNKVDLISMILEFQSESVIQPVSIKTTTMPNITALQFNATSILSKPNAERGDKCTTTLLVSSGASSGEFPVVGRSVAEVSSFLEEILNIDKMSIGHVSGKGVTGDYILKDGDVLEFIKAAGTKG